MVKWENTRAYRDVKKSLMGSLEQRGLTEPVYLDKAEEYLALWIQFQQLKDDIRENGVAQYDEKKKRIAENRSVALGVQVSRQMLNIYTALGFRELAKKAGDESGRELEDLSSLAEMLKP